jgi:SAM-dependent methyltransferase
LRRKVPHVVGIDVDERSIRLAEQQSRPDDIHYVTGDVLTHPLEPASFEVVASVATLHHADAAAGLTRMAELLQPGGRLAILGLARSQLPRDAPWEIAATAMHNVNRWRRGYWEHSAPTVWPPPVTYAGMRALVADLLPGATFRRHVLWRYAVVWTQPQP